MIDTKAKQNIETGDAAHLLERFEQLISQAINMGADDVSLTMGFVPDEDHYEPNGWVPEIVLKVRRAGEDY
ncbi:MAG: hypothetical protein ACR2NF_05200 [Pirellulales bacterium]